jgi:hypothetical protein
MTGPLEGCVLPTDIDGLEFAWVFIVIKLVYWKLSFF